MHTPRRRFLKSAASAAAALSMPCDAEPQLIAGSSANTAATAEPTASLPKVRLGKYEVTRLIIGANPFYGFSHFNRLFSTHMTEWATQERVLEVLRSCERNGINTWQFSYNDRSMADLKRHHEEGGKMQWILLSNRAMEEDLSMLPAIAKAKPIGIVHHGGTAERRWRNGELPKIREFLKAVRETGVMAGLSLHNPKLLELVEEQNWDIDFYMTALYYLTRSTEEFQKILGGQKPIGEVYLPDDPPKMCRAVRQTKKSCLCYKVLAAGRLTDSPQQIEQAFRFVYSNIKPQDCIIIGMYPRYFDQVRDNAERVRRILA